MEHKQLAKQLGKKEKRKKGKKERIDVENPNPGNRPGQIHYHDKFNKKFYYDIVNEVFYCLETGEVAPNAVNKLLENKKFWEGIQKGLEILGELK